jgi:hypothetical protein
VVANFLPEHATLQGPAAKGLRALNCSLHCVCDSIERAPSAS